MKTKIMHSIPALALLALSTIILQPSTGRAQGTAFTYQGRLNSGGSPASGLFDFRFRLDADPAGNTILATMLTNSIPVTNGLFTTTIDFGGGWFNGSNYWLEVDVRTNNFATYTALNPLQQITPAPYAVFANTASNVSGTVAAAQINGAMSSANLAGTYGNAVTFNNAGNSFSGSGANLTSLNANNLSSGTVPLAQLPGVVVTNTETGVTLSGTFNGNGTGLTNLNASQLTGIGNTNVGAAGNVFVGPSGNSTMSGSYNTAYGNGAFAFNTNGTQNVAVGSLALDLNRSGSGNTGVGDDTLANDKSGAYNTAVGYDALQYLGESGAGGSNNIALGVAAGVNFGANESYNIDIGNPGQALENNTIRIGDPTVQTQTFIAGIINGNGGGLTNLNASQLTSIDNPNNVSFFVGPSGNSTSSGSDNTAIGVEALSQNTSGSDNTASGLLALYQNTSGNANTAIGSAALSQNTIASYNTAVGSQALYNNTSGNGNTAIGTWALFSNTNGYDNSASGYQALYNNTSGGGNTANGTSALHDNTSGSLNTANGDLALAQNRNGLGNTAVGASALQLNDYGSYNTAVGVGALGGLSEGSNNIALGYSAGAALSVNESNNIDVGNIGVYRENNTIRIGTPGVQTNTFIAGVIHGNGGGLTNLNASQLSGGVISLAQLPVAVITNNESGTITLNGTVTASSLSVTNQLRLNDKPLYFRTGGDPNHGLAYNGLTVTNFGTGNVQVDGPVLWGFSGGALGVGGQAGNAVLTWNNGGVAVNGTISGNGGGLTNLNLGTGGNYSATISDGTTVFGSGAAHYTKMGNLVFFEVSISWSSKGSALPGNGVEISLPSALPPVFENANFTIGSVSGITFGNQLTAFSGGTSYIQLYSNSSGASTSTLITVSALNTSGAITISGFYRWQ